jgi:hypothetical protein
MTGFAFVFFYFIKNETITTLLLGFMTLGAGNIHMFTVELECCIIVVELCWLPIICTVATGTIGSPVLLKLIEMFIGMT